MFPLRTQNKKAATNNEAAYNKINFVLNNTILDRLLQTIFFLSMKINNHADLSHTVFLIFRFGKCVLNWQHSISYPLNDYLKYPFFFCFPLIE